jgi:magnesium chelatase subunit I
MDTQPAPSDAPDQPPVTSIRSLRELIDVVSGRSLQTEQPQEESGIAEPLPFPFLALVGQPEMKLALLLALINPDIGGVLLIGPRGTGKTTAVRSLLDLLPEVQHSSCYYGCLPDDIETGGMDAVCPDCAKKYAEGQPLAHTERVRLVELPLNTRLDDVVGGLDDRALLHERMRLKRGILANADRNLLYIDEVNLLEDELVDAILDAAAQGSYTVRRGPVSATYRSRFILVGSMNPEEGSLRPQIMDRFGLRVMVHGLDEPSQRLEAYHRVYAYRQHPHTTIHAYQFETESLQAEIQSARKRLSEVSVPEEIALLAINLIQKLKIDSLRAEITVFEAARAYAAADNRNVVSAQDIREVAPMALRLRRSSFINQYFDERALEEVEIQDTLAQFIAANH